MFQSWTGAAAGSSRFSANADTGTRRKRRSWHGPGLGRGIAPAMLLAAGTTLAQPVPPPEMQVSTFAGGKGIETATASTVDADGNLVVLIRSLRGDEFPLAGGGSINRYDSETYVARYGPQGHLLDVTRLRGYGNDVPTAVAIDDTGRIVVAGYTDSVSPPDAGNPTLGGTREDLDGFVTVLEKSDTAPGKGPSLGVADSILFGGSGEDRITGLAIDGNGTIHVSGTTDSADLAGRYPGVVVNERAGGQDGFVAGLAFGPGGQGFDVTYVAHVGGERNDALNAIGVLDLASAGGNGSATIVAAAGMTESGEESLRGMFGADGVSGERAGMRDALVVMLEIDPEAAKPVTPLQAHVYGSSGDESASALAVDGTHGDVFVAGTVVDLVGQMNPTERPADYRPLPTWLPDANAGLRVSAGLQNGYQGGDSDGFLLRLVRNGDEKSWSRWLSTYLGGKGDDGLDAVAFDGEWIHVAGRTRSNACKKKDPGAGGCEVDDNGAIIGLPVVNALYPERAQAVNGVSPRDGYYARIRQTNRDGAFEEAGDIDIGMATYLGGGDTDEITAIALAEGAVWLAGGTVAARRDGSDVFPVTDKAAQPQSGTDDVNFLQGAAALVLDLDADAFVVRLGSPLTGVNAPDTAAVSDVRVGPVGGAYIDDSRAGAAVASTLDADGNLVVVGNVMGPDPDGRPDSRIDSRIFVGRYDGEDDHLLASITLNGDGWDRASDVAVHPDGRIIVTGTTMSAGLCAEASGCTDSSGLENSDNGFIAVLPADLAEISSVTFVSGSRDDAVNAVAIDDAGYVHVAGHTLSRELETGNAITTSPLAGDASVPGGMNGFIAGYAIDDNGTLTRSYLAYVGGDGMDALNDIAVFPGGAAKDDSPRLLAVAGRTSSTDTLVPGTPEPAPLTGARDAMIAVVRVLSSGGSGAVQGIQSWRYGSSLDETANAIAIDGDGNLFVVGRVTVPAPQLAPEPDPAVEYEPLPWPDAYYGTIQDAYQGGASDGFVLGLTRLVVDVPDPDVAGAADLALDYGDSPRWFATLSTYLGGSGVDDLRSVRVEQDGNGAKYLHVAGRTSSHPGTRRNGAFAGLPIVDAGELQADPGMEHADDTTSDGYYARIRLSSTATPGEGEVEVSVATYAGGPGKDVLHDVVIGANGSPRLVGETETVGDGGRVAGFVGRLPGVGPAGAR